MPDKPQLRSPFSAWWPSKPNITPTHTSNQAALQNAQKSSFYKLPTELLLEIEKYLENPEIMALRAVCLKFATIFRGPNPHTGWPIQSKKAYQRTFIRQAFREFCGRWGGGIEEAAEQGKCGNGGEGDKKVLQLCPHISISYQSVKLKTTGIPCSRDHFGAETISIKEVGTRKGVKIISIKMELDFLTIRHDHSLSKTEIVKSVKQANWSLCPHIHTDSVADWNIAEVIEGGSGYILRQRCRPKEGEEECGTKYCLYRWGEGSMFATKWQKLRLTVERELEEEEDRWKSEADIRWIAQLVGRTRLCDQGGFW